MKLYANMMVYNEMPFLSYVVERLLMFCDHLVVMDNGSTDGSREWLEQPRERVTALFYQQASPPNHADMLNHMLEFIPDGVWVIKWDPDELPSDGMVRGLRDFLETKSDSSKPWRVPVYDMMKSRSTCTAKAYQQPRLFRKTSDTRFTGETHEHVEGLRWARMGFDCDIAIIHFSYFCETRFRRKAQHYATVLSSGFLDDPERLTDRLDLPTVPLPDHITFQASDEWLEEIRMAK